MRNTVERGFLRLKQLAWHRYPLRQTCPDYLGGVILAATVTPLENQLI
jgi:hypothetical protein